MRVPGRDILVYELHLLKLTSNWLQTIQKTMIELFDFEIFSTCAVNKNIRRNARKMIASMEVEKIANILLSFFWSFGILISVVKHPFSTVFQ